MPRYNNAEEKHKIKNGVLVAVIALVVALGFITGLAIGRLLNIGPASPASTPPHTPTKTPLPFIEGPFIYGYSFNRNDLLAYRLGTGPSAQALIGGIHGGYEWNTTVT